LFLGTIYLTPCLLRIEILPAKASWPRSHSTSLRSLCPLLRRGDLPPPLGLCLNRKMGPAEFLPASPTSDTGIGSVQVRGYRGARLHFGRPVGTLVPSPESHA